MHNLVAVAYVISGILFITALRGLSSPESSRRGNVLGIIGMFIAVAATLVSVDFFNSGCINNHFSNNSYHCGGCFWCSHC
jgi:NAD(P) transhydrogenase subunit beta